MHGASAVLPDDASSPTSAGPQRAANERTIALTTIAISLQLCVRFLPVHASSILLSLFQERLLLLLSQRMISTIPRPLAALVSHAATCDPHQHPPLHTHTRFIKNRNKMSDGVPGEVSGEGVWGTMTADA